MQLTQLFRRGILVPLTDRSAEQLSRWSVDDFVTVEFLPIGDQSLFDEIWQASIFQSLNSACSTLIDDYEEEVLRPDDLERAIATLSASQRTVKEPAVELFVESLIAICRSALEKHRPVYFVL
jgi:hypothetical protein